MLFMNLTKKNYLTKAGQSLELLFIKQSSVVIKALGSRHKNFSFALKEIVSPPYHMSLN